jgi:hypothetical protein
VQTLVAVALAFFAYIYFSGLSSTSSNTTDNNIDQSAQLALKIAQGETQFVKLNGERSWVSHLSKAQKNQLKSLAPFVNSTHATNACTLGSKICTIKMATNKSGIEIRYSEKAPAFLKPNIPWYGGFVDPSNQAVYDLLGRGYLRNPLPAKQQLKASSLN